MGLSPAGQGGVKHAMCSMLQTAWVQAAGFDPEKRLRFVSAHGGPQSRTLPSPTIQKLNNFQRVPSLRLNIYITAY